MSNDQEDPLCLVFVPALVTLLYKAEQTKGSPLTEQEVVAIRDNASCIALPYSVAAEGEKARGYPDIVAERCWLEWQSARKQLFDQSS
ncbi:hypothetical protein EKH79_11860 [Dyella dinghuensis]|uniref:Uncharacterized protein n=1 Tax=Dyella dinghuensis TaxID=1920169 RepID=A0A432LRD5_9GAMM|nr:hypothetical protein [Dyella dinghuensis]RUL63103.1 hypothetical protein EKH79_11860 [Dyella dinghuensis]